MSGRSWIVAGVCAAVVTATGQQVLKAGAATGTGVRLGGSAVTHVIDPKSGLDITIEREGALMSMSARDGEVTVTKRFTPGGVETTMATARASVSVVVAPRSLRVTIGGKTMEVSHAGEGAAREERERFARATPVQAARRLMAKLSLNDGTLPGEAFGLTNGLVGLLAGDASGASSYRQGAARMLQAPHVTPAAYQDMLTGGPLDCWNLYSRDAIKIWDDFIACKKDLNWYDFAGAYACDTIYVLQAELAFDWVLACEGGSGFKVMK